MDYELIFQILPPSKSHPGCTIRIKILFVCLLNTFVMLHLMTIKLRNKVVAALTISLDKQPIYKDQSLPPVKYNHTSLGQSIWPTYSIQHTLNPESNQRLQIDSDWNHNKTVSIMGQCTLWFIYHFLFVIYSTFINGVCKKVI